MTLPGGVSVTLSAGFLAAPAEVSVTRAAVPEPLPATFAAAYAAEAIAPGVTVRFPSRALGDAGGLAVRVPATVPKLEGEERLLAEVQLFLGDGTQHFFFQPYARVEGPFTQPAEGSDTVTLSAAQLRPTGALREAAVRVHVRPVRLSSPLAPLSLPQGFALEEVVSGLNQGVAFAFAPDGRAFIAEKGGVVRVAEQGVLRREPFIDLSAQVNHYQARGLLGFALHPRFPQHPYAYVLYTYDPPELQGRTGMAAPDNAGARVARLVRVTADAARGYAVAVPGSERVLLGTNSTAATIGNPAARNSSVLSCGPLGRPLEDCIPSDEISHTVGGLRFGRDGMLYVSIGDGSNFLKVDPAALRAQELDSLAGKLLRIDPETGLGLPDNPFFDGNPKSNRSRVLSYGLRNPFRFTLHPQTGEPFIGDVGWNTWEEVNVGGGRNFGWPCFEGGNGRALQQGGYRALGQCAALYGSAQATAPALYAYLHGSGSSSVQVGEFYTGTRYPESYRGALFINDFNQGRIRTLHFGPRGEVARVTEFATEPGVVQMGMGPGGELYLLNIYDGKLKRLRYTAPAAAPLRAVASGAPLQGPAPLTVALSSAGSSGQGGLTYLWDFGNGERSEQPHPSVTFAEPGRYRVTLWVSDEGGDAARTTLEVRVGNAPPTATILSPAPGARYQVGRPVAFSGRGSDPEDGALPGGALSWTLNTYHNDHVHTDSLPPTTGETGAFVPEDHGDNTSLELCLTARDRHGESARSCVRLLPETVRYTLDTVPTGLELPWEGVMRQTPFTVSTIVGATQQLVAPERQGRYAFSHWSDGGAAIHDVRVGATPRRFVATYRRSQRLRLTALCRDRWRVVNLSADAVPYRWRVTRSGQAGSGTVRPHESLTLRIPAGTSTVAFYAGGGFHSTLRPSLERCR
ncbi:PQQ-dependent sugar dehydrogenase [Truepera radiovictrix]|uniref:PQQ-dependent sugar dehydrogenase n=1 Tax=Truepera radiovictrix TaxID=332249 RepID=UPI0011D142D8|nr:PQQ-dependent sugar dehydrogenase [Truepera radiovictrix]WMT58080.1 PQQ-dependent sugar dehydrogenase [Truepera radiovictrix]